MLFFGVFVVLLYVATERISWVIVGTLLFAGGAYLSHQLCQRPDEVSVWLDVFHYTDGVGYQVSQSLFGLGTGGMFGTGLGVGIQRSCRCPHRLHSHLVR